MLLWRITLAVFFCVGVLRASSALVGAVVIQPEERVIIGRLSSGVEISAVTSGTERLWGLVVDAPGKGSLAQPSPAQVKIYNQIGWAEVLGRGDVTESAEVLSRGYETFVKTYGGYMGETTITAQSGVGFHVADLWSVISDTLTVERKLSVIGNGDGGFASAILFDTVEKSAIGDYRYFAPGTMYGAPEHVLPNAPGGIQSYYAGALEVREDMLPAALFGVYYGDGSSVSVFNSMPKGDSTAADFNSPLQIFIDERFRFGGFGAGNLDDGGIELGYWFPGTRGYLNEDHLTSPTGAVHRRYHPLKDGLTQEYGLAFRFGSGESFHDFYTNAWRWAWDAMKPAVVHHDIDQVRRSVIDMLAEQVETRDGRSGLPNSINMGNNPRTRDPKAIIGFTGKCIESAVFMIMSAARGESPLDAEHRRKALSMIDSFLKLKVAPPEAEGFDMETGELQLALPRDKVVYLRSFTDDMKSLLRGYEFEKTQGHEHLEWLAWCREFADWLLTQQQPAGGFPRSWEPGTGKVADGAPQSSTNPVELFVQLTRLTGDKKYVEAATRAAEFCWTMEHVNDHFVGGTIDNPNIIDKEAATMGMEAYLALYEYTKEQRWLDRAVEAAECSETFMYTWNVPMPVDAGEDYLHWPKGASTIGINVVSTSWPGLADQYLAFEVDEYVKLYKATGDKHYMDLATLLLHNTNTMLALPGREFDLPGAGWMSEHIGLGPPHRGRGFNFLWLPWAATCRLNGIFYTEQLDAGLFEEMKAAGR